MLPMACVNFIKMLYSIRYATPGPLTRWLRNYGGQFWHWQNKKEKPIWL